MVQPRGTQAILKITRPATRQDWSFDKALCFDRMGQPKSFEAPSLVGLAGPRVVWTRTGRRIPACFSRGPFITGQTPVVQAHSVAVAKSVCRPKATARHPFFSQCLMHLCLLLSWFLRILVQRQRPDVTTVTSRPMQNTKNSVHASPMPSANLRELRCFYYICGVPLVTIIGIIITRISVMFRVLAFLQVGWVVSISISVSGDELSKASIVSFSSGLGG